MGVQELWSHQAKPHTTDWWLVRVAWLLEALLPLFVLYAAWNRDWFNVGVNLLAIGAALLPRFMDARSPYRFPALGELCVAIILSLETFGRTFHLYEGHPFPFDMVAHTVEVGAAVTFAVLLLYAFLLKHGIDYDGWFILLVGMLVGLGLGAFWEIVEWYADPFFHRQSFQHGLPDTMHDLIAGAVGSFLGVMVAYLYRKQHSREEVTEELPIFYDWL